MDTYINSKKFIFTFIIMSFSIFLILYPFLYFFRLKFKKFLSDHVLFSICLILYFILLIPILAAFNNFFLGISLSSFIIKTLHIITILISMSFIVIIISRQFIMLIYKIRKITGLDILTTFLTYITLGLAFGSLYYILDFMSAVPLFSGIEKYSVFNFEDFLNHLYISLGSLSTVGSGNINPINPYIRLITVFETILGIFLTSFSLGFIFSVLGPTSQSPPSDNSEENIQKNISLLKSIKKIFNQMKIDIEKVENLNYE